MMQTLVVDRRRKKWASSMRRDVGYHSTLPPAVANNTLRRCSLAARFGLMLLLALALGVCGCHSRPGYEGKSVAQLQEMLADSRPAVQIQGAYGLSRLGPEARSAVPALGQALSSS